MRKIILLVLICAFIAVCTDVYAHPPSDIKIEHNSQSRMVTVIVTHAVNNVEKHFINKIEISLNGKEIIEHKISKQDNEKYQFSGYMITDVKPGDVITVEAYCSVSGKLRKEIKVK